jgi:molybdenum cofactor guanylyltransferase
MNAVGMTMAGYVLAGGMSSRMGQDKALLLIGSAVTMVQCIAQRVEESAGEVTLVGDPMKYGHLGFPVIPDLRQGCGPLAGMEAALSHSLAEWNLVLACDLANSRTDFLNSLCAEARALSSAFDCLVPQACDRRMQPLCALYRRRCLPVISKALDAGTRRVTDVVADLDVFLRPVTEIELFQNLNTPEDWNRYVNDRIN